ncbi:MAG: hypothetical protein UT30_C0032G0003 [Candidatus Uhrbacteria bacterium GW2011_GWF2_39_13]|uniref:Uncharacterized protein n=1 Tax=Candidatus Uhrbacteria bacterium GW2011_GWF2_39_13 TaxID=1618995 RepID=A0A0G0MGZ6_9BACT|nr:MAG: hypothetical protein UT30_C0032G0003 [Candidatus Uhrbacteria bacterium GW2011_GWF2_39_13]
MKNRKPLEFTLVELLIVISIIAILAAMLLPALSRAKKVTYKSSCMSKLKQIGTASFTYADDSNGQLPVYWSSLGELGCLPYTNYTISTSSSDEAIKAFKKKLAILQCPEDTVFGYIEYTWWYCTSYARNYHLGRPDVNAPKISRVPNPSGIIWVIDSTRKHFSRASSFCPLTLGGNRHFSGWNALFVDGHVDWGTSSKFQIGTDGSSFFPVE